ncbi:hypothetical protein [Sorangium sp. So ce1389]|uniref:hypothetical protein n=1 Tax=Sorangium sp. So ce1389 TaxID=3133336 RepID=UPI003F62761E
MATTYCAWQHTRLARSTGDACSRPCEAGRLFCDLHLRRAELELLNAASSEGERGFKPAQIFVTAILTAAGTQAVAHWDTILNVLRSAAANFLGPPSLEFHGQGGGIFIIADVGMTEDEDLEIDARHVFVIAEHFWAWLIAGGKRTLEWHPPPEEEEPWT